jgi:hypothetical protein
MLFHSHRMHPKWLAQHMPQIMALLSSSNPFCRRTALALLAKLPSESLLPLCSTIITSLRDPDGDARRAALEVSSQTAAVVIVGPFACIPSPSSGPPLWYRRAFCLHPLAFRYCNRCR